LLFASAVSSITTSHAFAGGTGGGVGPGPGSGGTGGTGGIGGGGVGCSPRNVTVKVAVASPPSLDAATTRTL
jgi:hypothetical protein